MGHNMLCVKDDELALAKMRRGLVLSQNGTGNYWLFDGDTPVYRVSRCAALKLIEQTKVVRDYSNTGCFGLNYRPVSDGF